MTGRRPAVLLGAVTAGIAALALPASATAGNATVVGTASSITVTFAGENTFGAGRFFPRVFTAGAQAGNSGQVRLRIGPAATGESLTLGTGNVTCAAATTGPSSDIVCSTGSATFIRATQAAGAAPNGNPAPSNIFAVGSLASAPDSNFANLQLALHVDGMQSPTSLTGSDLNDTFSGTSWSDTFDGGPGADGTNCTTSGVNGMAGDDTLTGGAGDDLLQGGADADTIDGGSGTDGTSSCRLNGGASSASGDGDDVVKGGPDADTIDGGAGSDAVSYDDSARTVALGAGGSFAVPDLSGGGTGGAGTTIGTSEDGSGDNVRNFEQLTATPLAETLLGTSGADGIDGAGGADTLDGVGGGHDPRRGR